MKPSETATLAPVAQDVRDLLSLDCASPDGVSAALRNAADLYRTASAELSAAWQDTGAGAPWRKLANILDRAADQCNRAVGRRTVS